MAALGWLVSLAQKQGPAKADEVVAAFRKAAEKTPADLRALWDWFYLCGCGTTTPATFAAGRALSRAAPTDPLALWAYLHALGGRHLGAGQQLLRHRQAARAGRTTPRRWTRTSWSTSWRCYQRLRGRDAPSWPRPRSSRTSPTS